MLSTPYRRVLASILLVASIVAAIFFQRVYGQCALFGIFSLSGSSGGGLSISIPNSSQVTFGDFPEGTTLTFPNSPSLVVPSKNQILVYFPMGGKVTTIPAESLIKISGSRLQIHTISDSFRRKYIWQRPR